jgi:hypothetical protein
LKTKAELKNTTKPNLRRGPVRLLLVGGGGGGYAKLSQGCPAVKEDPFFPFKLYEDCKWGTGGSLNELLCLFINGVGVDILLFFNLVFIVSPMSIVLKT